MRRAHKIGRCRLAMVRPFEQFLTLVVRGEKVDHLPGDHDDLANAAAGLVWLIRRETRSAANEPKIAAPVFSGAPSFTPGSSSLGYGEPVVMRKHPAEMLARGPSCASHRRSSNANSLCGRNS